MNASRRAKRVAAKDRVIERDGPVTGFRGFFTVLAQTHQIVFDPAQKFQIDQQLIHRRVADALSHAEG